MTKWYAMPILNNMNTKAYTTIRLWNKTAGKLRMLYGLTGKSQIAIIDRLVTEELHRIENKQHEEKENTGRN